MRMKWCSPFGREPRTMCLTWSVTTMATTMRALVACLHIHIYDHKTTRHVNKHLLYFVSACIYKNVAWCCPINIFKWTHNFTERIFDTYRDIIIMQAHCANELYEVQMVTTKTEGKDARFMATNYFLFIEQLQSASDARTPPTVLANKKKFPYKTIPKTNLIYSLSYKCIYTLKSHQIFTHN